MHARRILFDVTYTRLQHRAVGITRTVVRLAQALRTAARAEGVAFVCVAFDGDGWREVPAPAARDVRPASLHAAATGRWKPLLEQVLRLPWPLIRPLWAWASGRSFAQAAGSAPRAAVAEGDLLLLCDAAWNYPVDRGIAAARAAGAAVVSMVYDLMPLQAPQFCVPWVRAAFADWLARALRGSDAIVCDSRFTLDSLREAARARGWPLPPAAQFRLGCDGAASPTGAVRASLGEFLDGARTYACIGSFEPKKNHALLVGAFEALWRQGSDARLLVIGRRTGECESVVEQLAQHASRSGRVMLVDDANDAEVAQTYDRCRALLLPSLFEGFGLPLVEARTRGCRVFASDLPVFREIADAGVRWFDPRDPAALAQLIASDLNSAAAPASAPMPAFDWRDSARQCLERVDALLAGAGRASAPPAATRAALTGSRVP